MFRIRKRITLRRVLYNIAYILKVIEFNYNFQRRTKVIS